MSFQPWLQWLTGSLITVGSYLALFFALILLLFVLQRLIFSLTASWLGGKAIYLSAWLGTPIHELSHALGCVLFAHKIQRIVLFNPGNSSELGYVSHSYNNRYLWQVIGNFFIGIAPLFGGLAMLYLATYLLIANADSLLSLLKNNPFSYSLTHNQTLMSELIVLLKSAYFINPVAFFIWGYICAAISLHLCPSREDLQGGWVGLLFFIALCLLIVYLDQYLISNWGGALKTSIEMFSMIYLIGILWAIVLLILLLLVKLCVLSFKH